MWIAADDAYENSNFCLTPYGSSVALSNLSPAAKRREMLKRDSFNFYQSSMRISIECAFGMLVKRWGILWRSMTGTIAHSQLMVSACMSLHNVLIDMGESGDCNKSDAMHIRSRDPDGFSGAPRSWRDRHGYTQVEGRPLVHDQGECTRETVRGRKVSEYNGQLREELKGRLGNAGIFRPPHSNWGMTTVSRKRKSYTD
jgi:hypothetical protein